MSDERKSKVLYATNMFISLPMTIEELLKRTAFTEDEIHEFFNKDLPIIDYNKYVSVQKILLYLDTKALKVN